MITLKATEHISSITPSEVQRYSDYFRSITPVDHVTKFKRWLFAYASVHTSWQMNCKMYQALEDLKWLGDSSELKRRIISVGAGMHNNRTLWLTEFSNFFWTHPTWFDKSSVETWRLYRNRVMEAATGIGPAKAAFLVELTYPLETDVICTDTHMLQLYGLKAGKGTTRKVTDAIEDHWATDCRQRDVPATVARWIYWDRKMGYMDSRYWSIVLEDDHHGRLAQATCAA